MRTTGIGVLSDQQSTRICHLASEDSEIDEAVWYIRNKEEL